MKLIKIQDLTNRPVTNIELVSRYLFGDTMPSKFEPGTRYDAGQYVYTLNENNGTVTVYYCTEDGIYDTIGPNWVVASVPSIVAKLLENYELPEQQLPQIQVPQCGEYKYETYTDLPHTDHTITLPFVYDPHFYEVALYATGGRCSREVIGEYSITGNTITTLADLSSIDPENLKLVVTVLHKSNPEARLLATKEYYPDTIESISDGGRARLTVPVDEYVVQNSAVFDLYRSGRYIPEHEYTYVYDAESHAYVITFVNDGTATPTPTAYWLAFTYSLSKEVTIVKNDISTTVMSDVSRFQLDMRCSDFNDISAIHECYHSGVLIPNNKVVLYNSTAHIEDEAYYLEPGEVFTISYKNIIINSIFDHDKELSNDFQQVLYASNVNVETKRIPVPFVEFNSDINTLLVFKGDGYLISPSRYYIKDNILTFYPHDTSLVEGDKIIFQILNNDYSIGSYMKSVTVTQEVIDYGVTMPLMVFSNSMFDTLVFSSTGMFISSDKYTISGDTLRFNDPSMLQIGDNLDFIFFEYVSTATNTTMRMHTKKATSSTTLELPFRYDGFTDNVILFQSNGMYIDKSRYTISEGGTITITSGTTFAVDETIQILLVRKYKTLISVLNVPNIR